MYAKNIRWKISAEEIYERYNELEPSDAAKIAGIPVRKFERLSEEAKWDMAESCFRHNPAAAEKLLGLPEEVKVPDEVGADDIADYLEGKYGNYTDGYVLANEWVIGIGNSASNDVIFRKTVGTEEEVRNCVLNLIREDKNADKDCFHFASETTDDLIVRPGEYIRGYANYWDYHIDYVAKPIDKVLEVNAA